MGKTIKKYQSKDQKIKPQKPVKKIYESGKAETLIKPIINPDDSNTDKTNTRE